MTCQQLQLNTIQFGLKTLCKQVLDGSLVGQCWVLVLQIDHSRVIVPVQSLQISKPNPV